MIPPLHLPGVPVFFVVLDPPLHHIQELRELLVHSIDLVQVIAPLWEIIVVGDLFAQLRNVHTHLLELGDPGDDLERQPSVLTFDHQEALFDQNESFFVKVEGERVVQLVPIQFGTLLKATPHIVTEGHAQDIQLIVDVTDGDRLPQGQGVDNIPSVRNTQVSTQGFVGEGEALVIGGCYRDRSVDNISKVPFLGDIPGLGALFRSTNEERQNVARLFVIRPKIVPIGPQGIVGEPGPAPDDGIPRPPPPKPPFGAAPPAPPDKGAAPPLPDQNRPNPLLPKGSEAWQREPDLSASKP